MLVARGASIHTHCPSPKMAEKKANSEAAEVRRKERKKERSENNPVGGLAKSLMELWFALSCLPFLPLYRYSLLEP